MEDINAQDSGGWTSLHLAAANNDHVRVKLLLDQKANPHIYSITKNSPLMVAAYGWCEESFRILLVYETPETLFQTNTMGCTVLDIVLESNICPYAHWIVDAGGGRSLRSVTCPPEWFGNLLEMRKNIKQTLVVFHYLGRKNPYLKKDMTDKITKMIWETRDRDEWLILHEESSDKKIKI